MKQRLSNIDVSVLCQIYNNTLIGSRLVNIYDGLDTKTYILKFNTSQDKVFLLLESANRIHTIDKFVSCRKIPTTFCAKFRKHLKNKRLEKISQIGNDRIIDIQIGANEFSYHIILELFASGNIILTDNEYNILNTLRRHIYDDENKILVSKKYPINMASNYNLDKLDYQQMSDWFKNKVIQEQVNNKYSILQYLVTTDSPLSNIPHIAITHCLKELQINPNSKIGKNWNNFSTINFRLLIQEIIQILDKIKDTTGGYIIVSEDNQYLDFTPYLFKQFETKKHIYIDNYDLVVSKYYQETKPKEHINVDIKPVLDTHPKLDKVERRQFNINKQITDLTNKADNNLNKAEWIQDNLELISSYISNINNWLSLGYTISEIRNEIDTIDDINLKDKYFTIRAENELIRIFYDRNVYKNLTFYHDIKKQCISKKGKASNALGIIKIPNPKKNITKIDIGVRKKYWFEDFHWFYSLDGYIVVSGKSAEQNEALVKKYLENNDIYVHADYHGSGSCIVKNHNPNKDIPISTLEQAGNFVICWSKAWESIISDRAYWVHSHQVSKTAPSGEYLSTGSMMIRGTKNYLSMATMELGIGLIFQIKDQLPIDKNYRFVRNLKHDMEVISCIVMCCPYRSIQKADYRVKIIPGSQKRGKVFKDTISSFKRKKYITNEESYIYALSANDLDTIVPFKIKKN